VSACSPEIRQACHHFKAAYQDVHNEAYTITPNDVRKFYEIMGQPGGPTSNDIERKLIYFKRAWTRKKPDDKYPAAFSTGVFIGAYNQWTETNYPAEQR
jgi:hypothetical protein